MLGPSSSPVDRPRPSAEAVGSPVEAGLAAELRDVVDHLRRHGRGILLAAILMAVVGAVIATFLPRLYFATAQITVDPRGLRVFDNEVVPGGQLSDSQSALVETQARVLKSDSVLKPVVDRERLATDPEFDGAPQTVVAEVVQKLKRLVSPVSGPVDHEDVALANLGDAVKVTRVPNSFVLEMTVAAREADKAARLAQATIETFIDNAQSSREASAKQVSAGLASRLDALGAEVQRAETAVDTFKRENNIVDANGRPINEQQLGDLTNQLVTARVRTAELRSRYEQIQGIQRSGAVPDTTIDAVQSAGITQLRNRYAEIKQTRDSLLTSLGPRHPSLLAATAQLDGVKQLIAQEVARIAASARSDYERARATEAGLNRQLATVTQESGTINTAAIRLRELEREAQARRTVYESFLNRSRETREQSDLPTVNISVISAATPPLKKSGIPAPLIVAVVSIFGASAAALALLAFDHLAGRIMTPRQLGAATGLPLLAIVRRRRREGLLDVLAFWRRAPRGVSEADGQRLTAMHQALIDAAPEAPPRIVMFISGDRRAAAARVPLDFACVAGEAGDRILLVDTDGDSLTRPFDSGSGAERRDWTPIKRTNLPNLSVLAWSEPFVQSHAADSGAGEGALLQMARDFDYLYVHGAASDAASRLRRLAEAATNIVLVIDADAASIGALDVIRSEVGPCAYKVDGFVWVASMKPDRRIVSPRGMRHPSPSRSEDGSPFRAARIDAA